VNQAFDLAQAFSIALALAGALGGWILKSLFDRIERMEKELTQKISELDKADRHVGEVLSRVREDLPALYVRRDEFTKGMDNIFNALRRIEDKLDAKVDK